jgi:hypothetical protein
MFVSLSFLGLLNILSGMPTNPCERNIYADLCSLAIEANEDGGQENRQTLAF